MVMHNCRRRFRSFVFHPSSSPACGVAAKQINTLPTMSPFPLFVDFIFAHDRRRCPSPAPPHVEDTNDSIGPILHSPDECGISRSRVPDPQASRHSTFRVNQADSSGTSRAVRTAFSMAVA